MTEISKETDITVLIYLSNIVSTQYVQVQKQMYDIISAMHKLLSKMIEKENLKKKPVACTTLTDFFMFL